MITLAIITGTIMGAIVISFIVFMALDAYEHRQFDKEYKELLSRKTNHKSTLINTNIYSIEDSRVDEAKSLEYNIETKNMINTTAVVVASILPHNSFNDGGSTQNSAADVSDCSVDSSDCGSSSDGGSFGGD